MSAFASQAEWVCFSLAPLIEHPPLAWPVPCSTTHHHPDHVKLPDTAVARSRGELHPLPTEHSNAFPPKPGSKVSPIDSCHYSAPSLTNLSIDSEGGVIVTTSQNIYPLLVAIHLSAANQHDLARPQLSPNKLWLPLVPFSHPPALPVYLPYRCPSATPGPVPDATNHPSAIPVISVRYHQRPY